jgi:hypothetical protein
MSAPAMRRAPFDLVVKGLDVRAREVEGLISSPTPDRIGDVVEPKGGLFDAYRRNPIVLLDHQHDVGSIVGKALFVEARADGIHARTRFLKTKPGDLALDMIREGVGGWSIGFQPLEFEPVSRASGARGGLRYTKWELLEYSYVSIPMHREAVAGTKARAASSSFQPSVVPAGFLESIDRILYPAGRR